MRIQNFVTPILLLSLTACATGFKREGYTVPGDKPEDAKVTVIDPTCKVAIKYKMTVPEHTKKLGVIEAYDPALMAAHCCEELAMATFVKDACAVKANVINIVDETQGSVWHCYTAKAELLSVSSKDVKTDDKYALEKITERSKKMDRDTGILMGGALGGLVGAAIVGTAVSKH